MVTLRNLANVDRAIGSITGVEIKLISEVLDWAANMAYSRLLRVFVPRHIKYEIMRMRMLSATLNRSNEEMIPINESIRIAIDEAMRK